MYSEASWKWSLNPALAFFSLRKLTIRGWVNSSLKKGEYRQDSSEGENSSKKEIYFVSLLKTEQLSVDCCYTDNSLFIVQRFKILILDNSCFLNESKRTCNTEEEMCSSFMADYSD